MAKKSDKSDSDFLSTARKRWDAGYAKERENILEAYDDLAFRAGDQWPSDAKRLREQDGNRPCLTVNMLPQFIRQVTGDIRMMRPAMHVLPMDDEADEETAEDIAGLIRYIENQGDAQAAYYNAVDSTATCGIGAWRVDREYVSPRTFNQEIRIRPIEDAVSVIWDPNAVDPTREDAEWCMVPVDMSWEAFKTKYPDATVTDFNAVDTSIGEGWYTSETVRICEYWCKKQQIVEMALSPDGSVVEVADANPDVLARIQTEGWRREKRPIWRVYRSIISGAEVLEEETLQIGRYIPIIPYFGEEVKIGRRVIRHGIVRFAKDPQRIFNYMHSAEVESVALQPKAPWLGTEEQFKEHLEFWETANTKNHPYLPYTPDPKAPGAPQRVAPPVASVGLSNSVERSAQNMKAVIGIYDAQLGARSNETSGVAIRARQAEGDTGTFVYKDNFARALRYTFRVILDMIPHVYDTARTVRILGEDGRQESVKINQAVGVPVVEGMEKPRVTKDLTRGSYDIAITMGPSYSTKMQEATDGMQAAMQANPQLASIIFDLYVKGQDWPMANEVAERLEVLLPPEIRARLQAKKQGVPDDQIDQFLAAQQQQQGPDPAQELQMAGAHLEVQIKQETARKAKADADKAEAEAMLAIASLNAPPAQPSGDNGMVPPVGPSESPAPAADPRLDQMMQAMAEMAGRVEEITNVVREIAPPIMEELAQREAQAGAMAPPEMAQEAMPVQ